MIVGASDLAIGRTARANVDDWRGKWFDNVEKGLKKNRGLYVDHSSKNDKV